MVASTGHSSSTTALLPPDAVINSLRKHAVQRRHQAHEPGYVPKAIMTTHQRPAGAVEIQVRDNGPGLGLTLSHNIIAQGHGGTLAVEAQGGEFTESIVCLPSQ